MDLSYIIRIDYTFKRYFVISQIAAAVTINRMVFWN